MYYPNFEKKLSGSVFIILESATTNGHIFRVLFVKLLSSGAIVEWRYCLCLGLMLHICIKFSTKSYTSHYLLSENSAIQLCNLCAACIAKESIVAMVLCIYVRELRIDIVDDYE